MNKITVNSEFNSYINNKLNFVKCIAWAYPDFDLGGGIRNRVAAQTQFSKFPIISRPKTSMCQSR